MFSKLRIYFVALSIIAITVWSCSPALYQPLPEHATATVTHERLLKGRKLYVSACGSCHSLYLPEQYSKEIWVHNVNEMQERSKISDAEKILILEYLEHSPPRASRSKN